MALARQRINDTTEALAGINRLTQLHGRFEAAASGRGITALDVPRLGPRIFDDELNVGRWRRPLDHAEMAHHIQAALDVCLNSACRTAAAALIFRIDGWHVG